MDNRGEGVDNRGRGMDNRGEGGWTIGVGGDTIGARLKKVVVDNSKMVMYCQRTAKTCKENENRKHLNFSPNKALIVELGMTGN